MFRVWLHIIGHLILLAWPATCVFLILLAWLTIDNLVVSILLTLSAIAVSVINCRLWPDLKVYRTLRSLLKIASSKFDAVALPLDSNVFTYKFDSPVIICWVNSIEPDNFETAQPLGILYCHYFGRESGKLAIGSGMTQLMGCIATDVVFKPWNEVIGEVDKGIIRVFFLDPQYSVERQVLDRLTGHIPTLDDLDIDRYAVYLLRPSWGP